jgi:hypothetical protein
MKKEKLYTQKNQELLLKGTKMKKTPGVFHP